MKIFCLTLSFLRMCALDARIVLSFSFIDIVGKLMQWHTERCEASLKQKTSCRMYFSRYISNKNVMTAREALSGRGYFSLHTLNRSSAGGIFAFERATTSKRYQKLAEYVGIHLWSA